MRAVALRKKNSLFFNNFKVFIMRILYLIYLLNYSDNIIEKNIYYRYEVVIIQIISGVRLILKSRL